MVSAGLTDKMLTDAEEASTNDSSVYFIAECHKGRLRMKNLRVNN